MPYWRIYLDRHSYYSHGDWIAAMMSPLIARLYGDGRKIALENFWEIINHFSPDDQEIFRRCYSHQGERLASYREIEQELGLSPHTVARVLQRIFRHLRHPYYRAFFESPQLDKE